MMFDDLRPKAPFLNFRQYQQMKRQKQQQECPEWRSERKVAKEGDAKGPSSAINRQMTEGANWKKPPVSAPPIYLSFTRKALTRLPNGEVVGVYKETKTGLEIVFPTSF